MTVPEQHVNPLSFKRLAPGQLFLGCIKQVCDLELVVALPNRLFGRVPCNRVSPSITKLFEGFAEHDSTDDSPSLKNYYNDGEYVVCAVQSIHSPARESGDKKSVELSMLPSDVSSAVRPDELLNGLLLPGSVVSREDRGWIVDLGFATAFCSASKVDEELIVCKTVLFTLLFDKPSPVLQLSAKFNRMISEVFLRTATVVSRRSLLPGTLCDGTVKEMVEGKRLLLALPGGLSGFVDMVSLQSQAEAKQPAVGGKVRVRLTWMGADDDANIMCSLTDSVLKLATTQHPPVAIGSKLGVVVKAADPVQGVFFSSGPLSCFAPKSKLFENAETGDKDCSKKATTFTTADFTPATEHEARVIGYDPFESLTLVSLRPSVLKAQFVSYDGVKVGDKVKGQVIRIADFGLLVQLSDRIRAICPLFHLSDSHAASVKMTSKYTLHQTLTFRVLLVDAESRKVTVCRRKRLIDSTLPCLQRLSEARPAASHDGYVVSVKPNGAVVRFYGTLTAWLPAAELSDTERIDNAESVLRVGQSVTVKVKVADLKRQKLIVSMKSDPFAKAMATRAPKVSAGDVGGEGSVAAAVATATATAAAAAEKPVQRAKHQDTSQEARPAVVEPPKKKLKDFFERLPDDDKDLVQAPTTGSSPMDHHHHPGSADKKSVQKDLTDEYEKRLLGTPNASVVWIEYAAAFVNIGDVAAARGILERALRSISIREQSEKLNVWTALLNVENIYGSAESLRSVFERALQYTSPKHLYLRLADIFMHSGKQAEAGDLFEEMTQKKFKSSCKVWLSAITFHMTKSKNLVAARKMLPQALKALPVRKHIKCTLKCAQLEYRVGEVERGRTLFEGLLAASPKRIDLWLVYIQLEENRLGSDDGQLDYVRRLYERSLTLKLSSKKAKTFFKNFLACEKRYGDAAGVERVKQLAREYVEGQ